MAPRKVVTPENLSKDFTVDPSRADGPVGLNLDPTYFERGPDGKIRINPSVLLGSVTDFAALDSADPGAGLGPTLNLNRNSPSPAFNDLIGNIRFNAYNTDLQRFIGAMLYGWLIDATPDHENAGFSIQTISDGVLADSITVWPDGSVALGGLPLGFKFNALGTINATGYYLNGAPFTGSGGGTGGTIRTITGTADTPTIADAGAYLLTSNAGATTITIPTNAAQAFPIGAVMAIQQGGAGVVTIAPALGVTINSPRGYFTIASQYGVAQIKKTDTNTWTLLGDLGDPTASGLGQAPNYGILQADYALSPVATKQKAFNWSASGALTLVPGTYEFECLLLVSAMSGTLGNLQFDALGAGTAVPGKAGMMSAGMEGTVLTQGTLALSGNTSVTMDMADNAMIPGTQLFAKTLIRGVFEITTGGTIIPSIKLDTAASAIVAAGSYFKCNRIGNAATLGGTWT